MCRTAADSGSAFKRITAVCMVDSPIAVPDALYLIKGFHNAAIEWNRQESVLYPPHN